MYLKFFIYLFVSTVLSFTTRDLVAVQLSVLWRVGSSSRLGIEPVSPTLGVQSLSQWRTREVLATVRLFFFFFF